MKTKSVFLKCRFGDYLPNDHKAVDLDKDAADYLIGEGLAIENVEPVVISGDSSFVKQINELEESIEAYKKQVAELEGLNSDLTMHNAELEGQLALLDPKPPVKGK